MSDYGQAVGLRDVEPCKSCSECIPETGISLKGMKSHGGLPVIRRMLTCTEPLRPQYDLLPYVNGRLIHEGSGWVKRASSCSPWPTEYGTPAS